MRYYPALIALWVASMIALAAPVHASIAGRKNTAVGATGVALYELARGHATTGLVAAAGAGYAWHRYQMAHKRSNRRSAYLAGFREGARRSYRTFYGRRRYHRRR